jgi:hypothetical protein
MVSVDLEGLIFEVTYYSVGGVENVIINYE